MSLTITTDDKGVRIWRNDEGQFPRYSIGISKKNQDGSYSNCYFPVHFKKDVSVDNATDIKINNSFFSFNTSKGQDGKERKFPYLMVTDFEVIGGADHIDVPDEATLEDTVPFR